MDATGFLPRFEEYPREKVREYLDSYDGARLTPTLARQYPDLTEEYDVHDWECQKCSSRFPYDEIEVTQDEGEALLCPSCENDGVPVSLVGPSPIEQNNSSETADGTQ